MVNDFKRIHLETSKPKSKSKKVGRTIIFILVGFFTVFILIIGIIALILLPLRGVADKSKVLIASAKVVSAAVKNQDLEKAKSGLAQTRKDLTEVKNEYNKVLALKSFPFIGRYIQDGSHAIAAGQAGLDAADKAIAALEPNADLLGLKGGSKFVQGSADERIQVAVKTMKALTPNINGMAIDIDRMRKELDSIDPNRYPEKVGKTLIRSQMVSGKEVIDNAANLFVNAQPFLINLPGILGDPEFRRYVILFQNDKELRPTGGFITAYAVFEVNKGKINLVKADDIYTLDNTKSKTFPAPPEILKFHKDVAVLNIRDVNLSPDYKISMTKFEELYKTTSGQEKIDGIMAMDTHVLVEALKILGSISVYGREFSAETDKRCDCPKAVYELEDYSTRPVNYVRTARKDIIGVLMQQIMVRALGYSPSQYWGRLFQMMLSEINQKHILAYFKKPEEQIAVENFNMAGRIMTANETTPLLKYKEGQGWDYLHINDANMAGQKANMFVSEKVTKDTKINSDGTITTKLTIDYKNPYPGSDCGLESGGLCLNAPLRNWIRIFVPKGSKLIDSKGSQSPKENQPKQMDTYESLDKTVFEGFLIVNPNGLAKLELSYSSPVKVSGKYNLLIQKQPGTNDNDYTLKLNGKEVKKQPLLTDTEFSL
jgi:hypothetical protein